MLGNFTSNLNSPFFSNKHELIQVLVTANVTIHKYLKAKAMEASIGFSFVETADWITELVQSVFEILKQKKFEINWIRGGWLQMLSEKLSEKKNYFPLSSV